MTSRGSYGKDSSQKHEYFRWGITTLIALLTLVAGMAFQSRVEVFPVSYNTTITITGPTSTFTQTLPPQTTTQTQTSTQTITSTNTQTTTQTATQVVTASAPQFVTIWGRVATVNVGTYPTQIIYQAPGGSPYTIPVNSSGYYPVTSVLNQQTYKIGRAHV